MKFIYKTLTALLLATVVALPQAQASQKRKVLFIGIDGTRSDALQQAFTPHLDSLVSVGLFTYSSWHTGITVSGPSWSSILTGVSYQKHGVTNNSYTGSKFNQYPYITTLAKQVLPNLYAAEVVEWPPLIDDVYNDHFDKQLKTPDGQGATTGLVASNELKTNDQLDFFFVYFDQVDLTGHNSGFSPSNPAYISAIEDVDVQVGKLMSALKSRANYADEEWLILVTTDHGGLGNSHGGVSEQERKIWWIGAGKYVTHQEINGPDPGNLQIPCPLPGCFDAQKARQCPVQVDIGVTALHHLLYDAGVNPEEKTEWNLDGKSWLVQMTAVEDEAAATRRLTAWPNPSAGEVTLWLERAPGRTPDFRVTDMQGRTLCVPVREVSPSKFAADMSALPAGLYTITATDGATTWTYTQAVQR